MSRSLSTSPTASTCGRRRHQQIRRHDTNCDPDDVDFGIPANDDAIRSVRLLAEFVADAVIAGTGAPVTVEDMTAEPAAEAAAEATPGE